MDKRFLVILAVLAIVIGGVVIVSGRKDATPGNRGTVTNHVEGKTDSKVKLVEYGDFQCPACASYHQAVTETAAKYKDTIAFQFRNYPLFSIHPNAIAGARAAEAADLQGKYWPMHDKLYEENIRYINAQQVGQKYNTWVNSGDPLDDFKTYAKSLSLDATKFEADYKSDFVNDRVQADLAAGNKLNVQATPTFFINGKKITSPQATVEGFSKVIDAELAKVQ